MCFLVLHWREFPRGLPLIIRDICVLARFFVLFVVLCYGISFLRIYSWYGTGWWTFSEGYPPSSRALCNFTAISCKRRWLSTKLCTINLWYPPKDQTFEIECLLQNNYKYLLFYLHINTNTHIKQKSWQIKTNIIYDFINCHFRSQ